MKTQENCRSRSWRRRRWRIKIIRNLWEEKYVPQWRYWWSPLWCHVSQLGNVPKTRKRIYEFEKKEQAKAFIHQWEQA